MPSSHQGPVVMEVRATLWVEGLSAVAAVGR